LENLSILFSKTPDIRNERFDFLYPNDVACHYIYMHTSDCHTVTCYSVLYLVALSKWAYTVTDTDNVKSIILIFSSVPYGSLVLRETTKLLLGPEAA